MLTAVQKDIPRWSTKDYIELKKTRQLMLTGFVGFGCSFGGKWFGGYAK